MMSADFPWAKILSARDEQNAWNENLALFYLTPKVTKKLQEEFLKTLWLSVE